MSNKPVTSTRTPRAIPRAEAVGSLLRSPTIRSTMDRLYEGLTTAYRSLVIDSKPLEVQKLTAAADTAIPALLRRQIDAGLDVVTDGEVRRPIFVSPVYESAEGFGAADAPFEVRDQHGAVVYSGFSDPVVVQRLRKSAAPLAEEASYLRAITDYPWKLTLPAPSYFFSHFVGIKGTPYKDRLGLVEDIVAIEKRMVAEAIAAGARWVQFDFPLYPALVDDDYTTGLLKDLGGLSKKQLFDHALAADRRVTEAIPDEVTVGLHLCRGNFEGGFWSGSLAPLAERIFNELPHDRFLFEWEDVAREGDFSPIRHVPKGRIMAMGLISTKTTRVETMDEILRNIDAASKHLDVSQLAICPQCGFASLYGDHLVQAEDIQWRKLELIGKVADRVWGST